MTMNELKIGPAMGTNPHDYDCPLGDRVKFGENVTCYHPTYESNVQPILLDGKKIGILYERYPHDYKESCSHSFMVEVDKVIDSDRFIGSGGCYMAFSNLTDLLHYLKLL